MSEINVSPTTVAQECEDCQPTPETQSQQDHNNNNKNTGEGEGDKGEKEEDLMDPSTFLPPITTTTGLPVPLIIIEYCHRCKFGLRANWIQQELLSTFHPQQTSASISSILLIPKVDNASAGRFRIYLLNSTTCSKTPQLILIWDRKLQSGFPEMRILKQILRDHINPNFTLGHSDKP